MMATVNSHTNGAVGVFLRIPWKMAMGQRSGGKDCDRQGQEYSKELMA
jgi:hypothetical protein